ncbi:MAG: transporter substrate-binding domain-containing protein [Opitutales bacterium]|nr:transporter substrate-binding domain-containing protein [Opitutales bacterium]
MLNQSSAFCLVFIFLFLPLLAGTAPAAESPDPVRVGVTDSPPFSYQAPDGSWTGLTVTLWDDIARNLGIDYEVHPTTVSELLGSLREGDLDVGAAALVVTSEREEFMNFSHTFLSGGLSVATPAAEQSLWLAIIERLVTWQFFAAIGGLALLLAGIGVLAWLAERRGNAEQFGGTPLEGIGSGFWWSAVTMTTVGYGDKAPITFPGKLLGLFWMFASILLISVFTGAIASALTVSTIAPRISSFNDLYRARVGVVAGSQAEHFLTHEGVAHRAYPDTRTGLKAVAGGELDGFVNDASLLRYFVRNEFPGEIIVLESEFRISFHAIGLRRGFPLQEQINLELLRAIESDSWPPTVRRFIGHER